VKDFNDQHLLRDYAERRSEPAFTELVRRHIDWIHSTARRLVNGEHSAEDVTQAVFVTLAQNAGDLCEHPALTGWLHCTTRQLAAKSVRTAVRRQNREQEAAAMNQLAAADAPWEAIEPHLDAALGELSGPERDVILLRYFQKKSAPEVATLLEISTSAAQKRTERAVEHLRELFTRRGIKVGAGGLVVVISAHAVQAAPAGLLATIPAAIFAGTAVSATSIAIATTKTIAMTTLQKSLVTVTVAALAGAGIYEAREVTKLHTQVLALQEQQAPLQERIQQLQRERDQATNRLNDLLADNSHPNTDQTELLKLRGEVGVLRRQNAELKAEKQTARTASPQRQPRSTSAEPPPAALPADYPQTPDDATKSIFSVMASDDWSSFTNFDIDGGREAFEQAMGDKMKDYLKGMEIVSIGEPTNSFGPNMWFVPYTIRFQDGTEKSHRLHVAQDPQTKRWILKGGF
jgi:RNA polymerase sigma factor (sigma-70 family)